MGEGLDWVKQISERRERSRNNRRYQDLRVEHQEAERRAEPTDELEAEMSQMEENEPLDMVNF